jgi:hypothetical protein
VCLQGIDYKYVVRQVLSGEPVVPPGAVSTGAWLKALGALTDIPVVCRKHLFN